MPEQCRHLAVDDLGHTRDLLHQFLRRFGIILRVSPQMRDEGFAAWVASLFGDLYHFGTNAHDLAKADLVDLFSGQISRRFLTNTKGIIGRTIWLRRNTRRLGAGWLVACCVPRQLLV